LRIETYRSRVRERRGSERGGRKIDRKGKKEKREIFSPPLTTRRPTWNGDSWRKRKFRRGISWEKYGPSPRSSKQKISFIPCNTNRLPKIIFSSKNIKGSTHLKLKARKINSLIER
jgi:hypothetical protein